MQEVIESGDNLFEIIFEIDRKLQHSQQPLAPISSVRKALAELAKVLIALEDKQPDSSSSIFLKLVDCFIRCSSNSKRQEISLFLQLTPLLKQHLTSPQAEAFKRLKMFWDTCFGSDFESCRQILLFLNATIEFFYRHKPLYALLFEALNEQLSGQTGSYVYAAEANKLFEDSQSILVSEIQRTSHQDTLESLLILYKFAQQIK